MLWGTDQQETCSSSSCFSAEEVWAGSRGAQPGPLTNCCKQLLSKRSPQAPRAHLSVPPGLSSSAALCIAQCLGFPFQLPLPQLPCPTRHNSARDSTFSNCIGSYSTSKWAVLEQCVMSQGICKGSLRLVSSWFLFLFKRKSSEMCSFFFFWGGGCRIVLL